MIYIPAGVKCKEHVSDMHGNPQTRIEYQMWTSWAVTVHSTACVRLNHSGRAGLPQDASQFTLAYLLAKPSGIWVDQASVAAAGQYSVRHSYPPYIRSSRRGLRVNAVAILESGIEARLHGESKELASATTHASKRFARLSKGITRRAIVSPKRSVLLSRPDLLRTSRSPR